MKEPVIICGGCGNLTSACTCLSTVKKVEEEIDPAKEFIRFLLMIAKTVMSR